MLGYDSHLGLLTPGGGGGGQERMPISALDNCVNTAIQHRYAPGPRS